jgi:hypothetical protein
MLLPGPITTAPPTTHEVHITASSRQLQNLCRPYVKLAGSNMRYDIFIDAIAQKQVKGVCITNTQKSADIVMADDSREFLYFPDSYDIVSYLLVNDVPMEIKETPNKPTIVDIITVLIQVAVVRLVSKFFDSRKTGDSPAEEAIFEAMRATSYFGYDLYNLGKVLSKEDIDKIFRVISCRIYLNKRGLRTLFKRR